MTELVREIFSDLIDDPQNPMRSDLNRDGLHELAADIKANGLISPITVRPKGERFEIVAGHRRLGACRIAGIIKIPCVVRELTDEQAFSVMTAENLSREDVPLLDECRHYRGAALRFGKSVKEIAVVAGKSEGYIRSRIMIAEMPEYMQNYLQEGKLKLGVAHVLYEITDDPTRRLWVELAVRDGVSEAQAEFWVQGWRLQQLPVGENPELPPEGFQAATPAPVQFECAIDGQKYNVKLLKTLVIFEGNLPIFEAFINEWRKTSAGDGTMPPSA